MASFAAAKQSLQAAAKVELHQRTQAAKRLARESAERLAKAASAWAEPESLLGQDELLHTCNKDDTLLVLRAPLRGGMLTRPAMKSGYLMEELDVMGGFRTPASNLETRSLAPASLF